MKWTGLSINGRDSSPIKLKQAAYNTASHTVTLTPKKPFALTKPVQVVEARRDLVGYKWAIQRDWSTPRRAACRGFPLSTESRSTCIIATHLVVHFHAIYGESEAMVSIDTAELLEGWLPRRAEALVLEWAEFHRDELQHVWELARASQPLPAIPGLD